MRGWDADAEEQQVCGQCGIQPCDEAIIVIATSMDEDAARKNDEHVFRVNLDCLLQVLLQTCMMAADRNDGCG